MAIPEFHISTNNDDNGGASDGMPLGLQLRQQPPSPPPSSLQARLVEHLRELNAEAFLLSSSSTTATTPSHSWTSDLDTESTGSFFPERSTTLGSLIGLCSPISASPYNNGSDRAIPIDPHILLEAPEAHTSKKSFSRHRSSWCPFSLIGCGSSEPACEDNMSTSLAAFLEMERKTAAATAGHESVFNRNTLFNEDGILPPRLSGAPSKLSMEQSTSPSSSYLSADWSSSVAPPDHVHGRERNLANNNNNHHRYQQRYHLRRLSSSPALSSR